jgi:SPFH domain / Band 7 family.
MINCVSTNKSYQKIYQRKYFNYGSFSKSYHKFVHKKYCDYKSKRFCGINYKKYLIKIIMLSILIILMSRNSCSYSEICLEKNMFGIVYFNPYLQGIHYLFPTNTFIKFPSSSQKILYSKSENTQIILTTNDGLKIEIDFNFYFKLIPEKLGSLYTKYGNNYYNFIQISAKANILKMLSRFSSDQIINQRKYIHSIINQNLKNHIENLISVEILNNLSNLLHIEIPIILKNIYLHSFLTIQDAIMGKHQQLLNLIKYETKTMITKIRSHTDFILKNSLIEANQLIILSKLRAKNIKNSAYGLGYKKIKSKLNMTKDMLFKLIKIL